MGENRGWYSRCLPHFDGCEINQFVTFRLADSLPQGVLERIEQDLRDFKGNTDVEKIRRIERLIDQGSGSCILRETVCATIVQDSLKYHDGKLFSLHEWVIMPNHVHFLARFEDGNSLPDALQSLKSYTGHRLKELHPEMPSIWQPGYHDRYMRNEEHYERTRNYIYENPVKAKLCREAESFEWSSAFEENTRPRQI